MCIRDRRKEEAEDDDLDWEEEVLGEMEGGEPNDRFANYWNDDTGMTYPLSLAKIPLKNPWEIFAYLPFGNWNECPDTPDLMAVAKYWLSLIHISGSALLPPIPQWKSSWIGRNSGCWKRRCFLLAS